MKLLLDTHALLWWLVGSPRLSPRAAAVIADRENEIFLSAASAWEIALKVRKGALVLPPANFASLSNLPAQLGISALAIEWLHAERAAIWDVPHRDPFDRLLAAQAEIENLTLVTCDPAFVQFGTSTLW